ncbi:MAG: phytanoyl-CoA dioxygenase family protein [Caldilineaceae bacterium]
MLTISQKRQFVEEGYLVIPNAVSQVLVNAALRAVNHSIGHVGLGGEDMANSRSAFFCSELLSAPVILDLFTKSPVMAIAESLMGEGNVLPVTRAKPYPRFPLPLGEDAPPPRGHLDGIGNGSNGMAKGVHRRGFTAFAVIYLADLPAANSGNFTVWPKSHRTFADYFQRVGYQVLEQGMPQIELPEPPIMVTAKAGDLIIAHHQLFHTGGPNASANVRHAVIARLQHKDVEEIGYDAYTDIWREWPGVHEVL